MTRRRSILVVSILAACVLLCGAAVWWVLNVLPAFYGDPMTVLRQQTPVRSFYGADGELLYCVRTWDAQWRFPVPLSTLPSYLPEIMLTAEDVDFYHHHGVNYAAILRALLQNVTAGRIVSGASTISMQLAGMALPDRSKTMSRKFRQSMLALRLEQCHTKQEILEEYLNRIPFGGNVYGIEAAARYYFGHSAKDLDFAECTLLCGLPQRPNIYRPDRHPERARERQRRILGMLVHRGIIREEQAREIGTQSTLRYRDFRMTPAYAEKSKQTESVLYFQRAEAEAGKDCFHVQTAMRNVLQQKILTILRHHVEKAPGVQDAAAVLMENKSGRVLAYVGTLDFRREGDGQADAARGTRSAGSALKPFLYAEAMNGGMLVMDTILSDRPLRYGTYTPGNYSGTFSGAVPASQALSRSLNTPAVRILAELGVQRAETLFANLLLPRKTDKRDDGLSLALGSAGYTLLELTNAYRVFPNLGVISRCTFLAGPTMRSETNGRVFDPGACVMIREILSRNALPGMASHDFAWKTGTSNGNHDAWTFVWSTEYTLGVWFGNKNGSASPALVGVELAAPAAGEIMRALYRDTLPGVPPDPGQYLEEKTLCRHTGLIASANCHSVFTGKVIKGIPLRVCTHQGSSGLRILSPKPLTYSVGTDGTVHLPLSASARNTEWIWNGRNLGTCNEHAFPPGNHTIQAVRGSETASMTFRVVTPPEGSGSNPGTDCPRHGTDPVPSSSGTP